MSKYLKDKSEGKESVSNVEKFFNLSGTFKDHKHEILSPEFEVIYACSTDAALIKKKRKFSSNKRTYEEMRKYLVIYEEAVSHI